MTRKLTAAILSGLVCPGAGQIYNGQRLKGGVLIAATLGFISAVVYKTWTTALGMITSMPPEDVLGDLFGLAHKVLEADKAFYDKAVMAFIAVWVYGMVDAYFSTKKRV